MPLLAWASPSGEALSVPARAALRKHPPGAGLTLAEALWLVLLAGAIVAVILGTLSRDRQRAAELRARDAMGYLERVLGLELPPDPGLPLPLAGPGEPPAGLPATPGRLAEHLPPEVFLPVDPWGRAYVLLRRQREGRSWRVLACGGPEGRLGDAAWERPLAPEP